MSSRFSRIILFFAMLANATLVCAADDAVVNTENIIASKNKPFSISGFGTLAVTHSNTRDVDIIRDLSQNEGVGYTRQTDFGLDSNFGVQINKTFGDNFDSALQVISRRSADGFRPEVVWAYGRYMPDDEIQLRAGRLGFDVYLLADSRNVGYSYQWVRPPVEFFGSLIISYFDGADMVISKPLGEGNLRAKFFAGIAREKTATGDPGNFLSLNGSYLTGGHIEYQTQNWMYRVGYTELKFKNGYPPLKPLLNNLRSPDLNAFLPVAAVLADGLEIENKKFRYFSAGIAYDQGPLQAQLMVNRLSSGSLLFPANRAAYLTVGYRMNQWTPYVTYSASRPSGNKTPAGLSSGISPAVDILAAGYNDATASQFSNQDTLSIGVRYDLTEKSNLKFQVDQINTKQYLLIRNNQANWNGKARLVTLAFNYIF